TKDGAAAGRRRRPVGRRPPRRLPGTRAEERGTTIPAAGPARRAGVRCSTRERGTTMSRLLIALCLAAATATAMAAGPQRVDSERSLAAPPAKAGWRRDAAEPAQAPRLRGP